MMRWNKGSPAVWIGLENEEKPSEPPDGTVCISLDAGKVHVYYHGAWYEV